MKRWILGIEFDFPSGTPEDTIQGEKMECHIYDNKDGTATVVCSLRDKDINIEDGHKEHPVSEILERCKDKHLELRAIIYRSPGEIYT